MKSTQSTSLWTSTSWIYLIHCVVGHFFTWMSHHMTDWDGSDSTPPVPASVCVCVCGHRRALWLSLLWNLPTVNEPQHQHHMRLVKRFSALSEDAEHEKLLTKAEVVHSIYALRTGQCFHFIPVNIRYVQTGTTTLSVVDLCPLQNLRDWLIRRNIQSMST